MNTNPPRLRFVDRTFCDNLAELANSLAPDVRSALEYLLKVIAEMSDRIDDLVRRVEGDTGGGGNVNLGGKRQS